MTTQALPTCRCGHDRNHPLVETMNRYGIFGWLAMINGVTAKPKEVVFVCRRCRQSFDRTRDPEELSKHA
ncbi:MAG: hypothetical protein K1X75_01445 [Leptospirales bacterium]|nr:hypothetical protein [Leptospirales bacterium]